MAEGELRLPCKRVSGNETGRIGVVIVSFNAGATIAGCLESLFASADAAITAVVVDNNSTDDTVDTIRTWASGAPFSRYGTPPFSLGAATKPVAIQVGGLEMEPPQTPLTLVQSPINGGFAYACNVGLRMLLARTDIDAFWLLNPDCIVRPDVAQSYLDAAESAFGLLGCRTVYYERPDLIQSDGGVFDHRTAVCRSVNNGLDPATTPLPDGRTLDYISGANMVVSRRFIEQAGLMPEDYFLYYEEVDWAQRRGALPLRMIDNAVVYHVGGTSIGSGDTFRVASPLSHYFSFRNRLRFARRHHGIPLLAYAYNFARIAKLILFGDRAEAVAAFTGTLGLKPPQRIDRLFTDATTRAFAFRGRAGPP